jgi:hypothetical protein
LVQFVLISHVLVDFSEHLPWFQRFIFIIFIAKGRGKINLWNQGTEHSSMSRKITKNAIPEIWTRHPQTFIWRW